MPVGEPRLVTAARDHLAEPVRSEACGPYRLLTDAEGDLLDSLRALCAAPVAGFEREYRARLGVPLHHPPRGTLVLFADRRRFRTYVEADGELPQGYAGFSLAAAGLVALPAGDLFADDVARTLAHELAHLAHRRAFGVEPEPWLAEGLADAVGDSARAEGFAPLAGFAGVEGLRERLLGGYASGRAGSLERLAGLDRDRFDRGRVSYDYDQSALLVRFLLLDTGLAPRFRAWLAARTWLKSTPVVPVTEALGIRLPELERRFRAWLGAPAEVGGA
ncbi:MAG: hypothetical protein F9K18_03970 [Thermoanaerobaculia bacterium]|nr:MAG: hypothetical protein F9K18_03970 [Thermoanaerobaculia bacterium]